MASVLEIQRGSSVPELTVQRSRDGLGPAARTVHAPNRVLRSGMRNVRAIRPYPIPDPLGIPESKGPLRGILTQHVAEGGNVLPTGSLAAGLPRPPLTEGAARDNVEKHDCYDCSQGSYSSHARWNPTAAG